MEILHHFVHFLLASNIIAIYLDILSTSLLQSSTKIEEKIPSTQVHNSSIHFKDISYQFNFFFKIAQDFL